MCIHNDVYIIYLHNYISIYPNLHSVSTRKTSVVDLGFGLFRKQDGHPRSSESCCLMCDTGHPRNDQTLVLAIAMSH